MVKVWIPFLDPEKHYIVANLYYSFMTTVLGIIEIALDCMILYPIVYFIFRINMLKYVLQNPEEFVEDKRMQSKEYKFHELMVKCISEHQSIIRTIQDFNNMMKHYLLFDFSLHALQISGVFFFIAKNMLNSNNFLNYVYALSLLIQLFILYWYGQKLLDENESISNAIYMSKWYCEDIKSQRLILLLMQRSQKPLGLMIGPIGIVQLEKFLMILKTVYTIFTVYSNM
ncbi:odorant receptor 49b-like [Harmonia axyridis]|uniref:odorant receptor 49b-like n=1 Tax=Harmonia axyridis TaxID=115357 RepID=UPI001E277EDC|nr:odorant receptor 49b-like [Harmonia axyridis]